MTVEALLVFALAIGLGWPLGRYLAAVMRGEPMKLDRAFAPVERPLYRLLGTDPARGMSWRGYAKAFVLSNLVVGGVVWAMFMTQAWLPLNPDAIHVPSIFVKRMILGAPYDKKIEFRMTREREAA